MVKTLKNVSYKPHIGNVDPVNRGMLVSNMFIGNYLLASKPPTTSSKLNDTNMLLQSRCKNNLSEYMLQTSSISTGATLIIHAMYRCAKNNVYTTL